jgi:hypothetical protein
MKIVQRIAPKNGANLYRSIRGKVISQRSSGSGTSMPITVRSAQVDDTKDSTVSTILRSVNHE